MTGFSRVSFAVSNLNWDAKYSTETKCRFPILVSLTWRVRHLLCFHNNSWGHRGRLQGSFVFFCEWRHSKEGREYLMMRRRDSNIQRDKRWRVTPFETLCAWKREEFCFNLFRFFIFFYLHCPFFCSSEATLCTRREVDHVQSVPRQTIKYHWPNLQPTSFWINEIHNNTWDSLMKTETIFIVQISVDVEDILTDTKPSRWQLTVLKL